MEAADEGRDLAALHGLSFTLPAGLLTPLTGGKLRLLKVALLFQMASLETIQTAKGYNRRNVQPSGGGARGGKK